MQRLLPLYSVFSKGRRAEEWRRMLEREHITKVMKTSEKSDFSCGFILETDSSFNSLGAVLSQKQEDVLVLMGYASRALRPYQRNMQNYSSIKLELLALHWVVTSCWELSSLSSLTITL